MLNPTYLTCSRHNIYYFRYPLPKSIHPQNKATDLKLSLRTKDSKKALYFSRALAYLGEAVINRAMGINMAYAEMLKVLRQAFSDALQRAHDKIAQDGPLSPHTTNEYKLLQHNFSFIFEENEQESLQNFIQTHNLKIDIGSKDYTLLRTAYIGFMKSYYSKVLEMNDSFQHFDIDYQKDNFLEANPVPVSDTNLSELISLYVEERTRGDNWTSKTKREYLAMFALLIEIVGEGKLCSNFGLEDARKVKDVLCKLPARYRSNPKTQDLPIQEVLKVKGLAPLHVKTANKHLATFSSLFKWAAVNGYLPTNYFDGLAIKQASKSKQVRKPFTEEQTALMLHELTQNTRGLVRKDYQKWGPLIGLFTGARLNEIAQLALEDIKQVDGIWCFDINDQSDHKQIKNKASKRLVPIHPKLVELGLLSYVDELKEKGRERLFFELTYDINNGYGRNLGRWFNSKFLVSLGVKKPKLVFHSIRHTVVTKLYRANIEEPIVKEIVGHSQSGVTQQVYFGERYSVEQLATAIEKLHYTMGA